MLTPDQIEQAYRLVLRQTHDPGAAGITVAAMMENDPDHLGPYNDETRDWLERWFTEECSYNRIDKAMSYVAMMYQGYALATDEGENLLGDDDQLVEIMP